MGAQKRYSREFKLEAAKLVVEHGYSINEAAARLGATAWSVRYWINKFRDSGDLPKDQKTVATAGELSTLRKEIQRLRMENEILKKAAAYFAKESL
jgi:transposase-like protein